MGNKKLLKELYRYQIGALRILSIGVAVTMFLFSIITVFFLGMDILFAKLFIPYSILMLINIYVLKWHKNVPVAYNFITIMSILAIGITTYYTGGMEGGFMFLIIAISTATFIYSKRQGAFWFVFSLLFSTSVFVLDINGFGFKQVVTPDQMNVFKLMVFLILIIFTAFIAYSFSRSNFKAFKTKRIIDEKNQIIEKKNEQIMDSIRYAKKIQDSLLASDEFLDQVFKDHFVLYKPKDVVGGDFYWAHKTIGEKILWAVGDCTGHGVPGAFMSMIGVSLLNEIVIEKGIREADIILQNLGDGIIRSLNQEEAKSGMEVGLCVMDLKRNIMQYSGAKNPLYLVRGNELIIYEGSKKSVGFNFRAANDYIFEKHFIDIQEGDVLYMFSDGYYDQIGGPEGKRFMSTNMQKLLIDNALKPMKEQHLILNETLRDWLKNHEQIDDIVVMGVKI